MFGKFIKPILIKILIVIFSLSNVGVTFTSSCCPNEVQIKPVVQDIESDCCTAEQSTDHICLSDCDGQCFTTYNYVKLNFDQVQIVKQSFKAELTFTIFNKENYFEDVSPKLVFENQNRLPPKNCGRSLILSLNKPKIPSPLLA